MELKLKQGRRYTRNLSIWVPEALWKDIQMIKDEVENPNDHYRQAIEQVTEKLKAGVKALKRG